MITREQLLKNEVYWTETIQNRIFNDLANYIDDNDISQKEIAEKLGLSKGRISQILNGRGLNFRIDTLVKICLAIGKVPSFTLEDLTSYVERDGARSFESQVFSQSNVKLTKVNEEIHYIPTAEPGIIYLIQHQSVNKVGTYTEPKTCKVY